MSAIDNLMAELDERRIAQMIGGAHDNARARFPLRRKTVESFDEYEAWRRAKGSFEDVAAMTATNFRVNVTGRGEPVQAEGVLVSAHFFDLLGVRPVAGRGFRADDDAPSAAPVALVREGFWRRQFGGDPSLVGSALTLDGDKVTVVGVLGEGVALPRGADFWFPAAPGLGRTLQRYRRK